MNKINREEFLIRTKIFDIENKEKNIKDLMFSIYNKTLSMFKYNNLPDGLPETELEKLLQIQGQAFVTKIDNEIVALSCSSIEDEVDTYNRPFKYLCFNPATKKHIEKTLDQGVLIQNDFFSVGLLPLINKYATLLFENTITLYVANFWKRTPKVFIANDDGTKTSVEEYLRRVEKGDVGVITSNMLYESIKISGDQTVTNSLSELIEYDNYMKTRLYNEIGISGNTNFKKERLINKEVDLNAVGNYPLIDNMILCRQRALTQINEMFGSDIEVQFNSSWEYRPISGEKMVMEDDEITVENTEENTEETEEETNNET